MPKKEQGGDDLYDSMYSKIKGNRKFKNLKQRKAKLREGEAQYKEAVRQEGKKEVDRKMKVKILGKKSRKPSSESWQEESSMLIEPKDKKVKRAKIKLRPMSKAKSKPVKKGKLIIRKGGGKAVKDEQFYKTKMMRADTVKEEKKYYKLMKKVMDK